MIRWFITWVYLLTPIAGPTDISYGKEGFVKVIEKKMSVVNIQDKDKGLIVIIKPSKNQITVI
jgi:hypothetical protein